jgi:peptide/nickel transport system substrate-binding protein
MTALLSALLALPVWAAPSTDTFISADADRVFTLDPAAIYDRQSFAVALNIFEPLVVFGTEPAKATFLPFLSDQVPTRENGLLSKDGTLYAFPIRKGVRFHDGSELTPEDVRYSILRFMLQDRDGGPSGILLKPILGVYSTRGEDGALALRFKDAAQAVRVEGDKVVITLKEPYEPFLSILASWPFVLSKEWAASQGDWDGTEATWKRFNNLDPRKAPLRRVACGTGPFMLAPSSTTENLAVLTRHDAYWRGPAPLKALVFHQVDSELMRLSMLQTGDADSAELSRSSLKDAAAEPGILVLDDLPSSSVGPGLFFTFQTDPADNPALGSGRLDGKGIPPDFFSDPDVRRGFACAFDYDLLLNYALRGKGERAEGPFPFKAFGLPTGGPVSGHDREKAAEHLRKAHGGLLWKNGFRADIAYNANDATAQSVAEILSASLREINASFSLRAMPMWRSSLEKESRLHRLPLFISGFEPDYPDLHSYAFTLLHSAGSLPRDQRFSDARIDALVDEAMRSSDEAARARTYAQLQELYREDLPQLYFFYPPAYKAVRKGLSGLRKDDKRLDPFNLHNAFYFYRIRKD